MLSRQEKVIINLLLSGTNQIKLMGLMIFFKYQCKTGGKEERGLRFFLHCKIGFLQ